MLPTKYFGSICCQWAIVKTIILGQSVSLLLLCGCELLNPVSNLMMEGTLFTLMMVEGAFIQG